MEPQFWIDSWNLGGSKTSFHRRDIHPYVLEHLPPSALRGKRVLVPLCGKTLDMAYFREHAAHVIGVELVEQAVLQFFAEQSLPFTRWGNRFEAERLTLVCGDFFSLTPEDTGRLDLVYDRAALVALPLPMRRRYVAKIEELLPIGGRQLINTLEYAPLLPEPPFSISPSEVLSYYAATHSFAHLESALVPDHGMVRKYGLQSLREHAFLLTKER
jgi:thiopurine S-methyltransferase